MPGFPPYFRSSQMLQFRRIYRLCASPEIQNYNMDYFFLPLVAASLLSRKCEDSRIFWRKKNVKSGKILSKQMSATALGNTTSTPVYTYQATDTMFMAQYFNLVRAGFLF